MAILEMKRIELLAMLNDSKAIMDLIQQYGVVEISDYKSDNENLYKLSTSTSVSQIEKQLSSVTDAMGILNQYAPAKGSMLDSFKPRSEMTLSEFFFKAQETDAILNKCYEINSLYKEIQDKKVEIIRAQTSIDSLKPWVNLDVPTSLNGTEFSKVFIGSFADSYDRETLLGEIAKLNPEINCDAEIISVDKNQTCVLVICHKDDAKGLEKSLREIGFIAQSDTSKYEPKHNLECLESQITKCNEDIVKCEELIKAHAEDRKHMEFLVDYFVLRTDKYKALNKISMSDNVFVLSGYIPEKNVYEVVEKLEEHFDVAINITEPDYENDDVPVAIENGTFGSTMESVTNMYSPPSRKDIDPNSIMPFFYYCFFGLMLSDAGYGLVMVAIALFIKFKFKLESKKATTVNYILFCGLSTTFWGILFNGWFGDLPSYLHIDFIKNMHFYWFEPLKFTTEFLLFCLFLGILHLMLGVFVNLYATAKRGHVLDAIFDNVPILLILVGILPVVNSQIGGEILNTEKTKFIYDFLTVTAKTPLTIMLLVGAILVVLTHGRKNKGIVGKFVGGLSALYNTASGYLGDILSYARLLALGLCTGVIASVINMLAKMPNNIILFVIVLIIGHTINLAINLIGTYVHTNRLQYVEFFSKFYEGGGREFSPLNVKSKSFKFKEEIKS